MKRNTLLMLAGGALAGYAAVQVCRRKTVQPIPFGAQVVILGAGSGGLEAAKKLASLTAGHVHITVVDRDNYHLFTPMLYQVASCSVAPYDVAAQLRPLFTPRGIHFRKSLRAIGGDGKPLRDQNRDLANHFNPRF